MRDCDQWMFVLTTAAFVYHTRWTRWKRWFDATASISHAHHVHHTTHTSSPTVTTDDPTVTQVIEFQIGAGMWSYYVGVSRHLAETMDMAKCIFVGYSAGLLTVKRILRQQYTFDMST